MDIHKKRGRIDATIDLPVSKSISNRALIINHLKKETTNIPGLSEANDTKVLNECLLAIRNGKVKRLDVEDAGSAMRFLTALLSLEPGEWLLTGSKRMKERPIGPLVDALRIAGATIDYMEETGYPPLRIRGNRLRGGEVEVEAGVSSQFISALLLIGPYLENGLTLSLNGRVVSSPYIQLTLDVMAEHEVEVEKHGNVLKVPGEGYRGKMGSIEKDWSSAAFVYEWLSLREEGRVFLPGLSFESSQGDRVLTDFFAPLGVHTEHSENGIVAVRESRPSQSPSRDLDLSRYPDLAQPLAVTYAAWGYPVELSGLGNLRVKETDRIQGVVRELKKFGFDAEDRNSGIYLNGGVKKKRKEEEKILETYGDHRMAMAFAPLVESLKEMRIKEPDVVEKSFPGYWEEMEKAGFYSRYGSL